MIISRKTQKTRCYTIALFDMPRTHLITTLSQIDVSILAHWQGRWATPLKPVPSMDLANTVILWPAIRSHHISDSTLLENDVLISGDRNQHKMTKRGPIDPLPDRPHAFCSQWRNPWQSKVEVYFFLLFDSELSSSDFIRCYKGIIQNYTHLLVMR